MSQDIENKKDHGHGKPVLEITINGKKFEWTEQYITGLQVRKLGEIPKEDKIFLDIEKPWEDEPIEDNTKVDIARPGIEQFFSCKHQDERLVTIHINGKEYKIHRGKHTVAEIKKIGNVPLSHDLEEMIKGKLTPLDDNGNVVIKGCEEFFSHVKDGSSS